MMNINLTNAKKIAWKFHRSTGIELEELFGEASLAYARALVSRRYDAEKASIDTWIYTCMRNHLICFCREQNGRMQPLPKYIVASNGNGATRIDQLGKDAQIIRGLVMGAQKEFADLSPRLAKIEVRKRLRAMDWKWHRIFKAFKEIKGGI